MTTAAITVVASLVVVAIIGFVLGWNRGQAGAEQREAWRQREIEQLRLQLREATPEDHGATAREVADLEQRVAERDRELALRTDQAIHLQQQIDAARQDAENRTRTAAGQQSVAEGLERESEELRLEIENRDRRLAQLGEEHAALRQQFALGRDALAALQEELDEARRDQSGEADRGPPAQKLDAAQHQLRAARAEIATLQRELADVHELRRAERLEIESGHDRMEQAHKEELESALGDLQAAYDERKRALDGARVRIAEIEAGSATQIAERDERIRTLEAESAAAAGSLDQERQTRRGLQREIERMLALRQEDEHAVAALQQTVSDSDGAVQRARDELEKLEARYEQQLSERDVESARLQTRLRERTNDAAELRKELSGIRDRQGTVTSALEAERRQRTAAEKARDQSSEHAAKLQSELDKRSRTVARLRKELVELEGSYGRQIANHEVNISELLQRTAAAEAEADDGRQRTLEHEREIERLERRGAESEQARRRVGEQVVGLTEQLEQVEAAVEQERAEATRAAAAQQTALDELDAERTALTSEIRDSREQRQRLEIDLDKMRAVAAQAAEQTARDLRERDLEILHLTQSMKGRDVELRAAGERAAELEQATALLREELDGRVAQDADLHSTIAATESELAAAHAEISVRDNTIESLRADLVDAEAGQARQLRAMQLEKDSLARMLQSRDAELEQARRRLDRSRDQLQTTQRRLHQRQLQVDELETAGERLDRVRDRLLREVHDREQEARLLRRRIESHAPANDDLTKIRGIGPAISEKLAEIGIASYRQIVSLEKRDIDWIQERIPSLRGKLDAEQWAADALEAHLDKYEEAIE